MEKRRTFNLNVPFYIDLAFCILLLPAMVMLLPVDRWIASNPQFLVLLSVWLYTLYFLCRRYAVPMLLSGGRKAAAAVLILCATLGVTILLTHYQFDIPPVDFHGRFDGRGPDMHNMDPHSGIRPDAGEVMPPHPPFPGRRRNLVETLGEEERKLHQQAVWFLYTVVLTFGTAVGLLDALYRQRMEKQVVEYERKKAELALYKAQINPHFLFNTLNTLYGFVLSGSDKAEAAFNDFIDLMKYMYENASADSVPVGTEAEYIEKYIAIQKYRLTEKCRIDFRFSDDGACPGVTVAPMILITFVENAVKYGVSPHENSHIVIDMELKGGTLLFRAENPVMKRPAPDAVPGVGIANCRKRLDLLYPGRHTLRIEDNGNLYRVNLEIGLKD